MAMTGTLLYTTIRMSGNALERIWLEKLEEFQSLLEECGVGNIGERNEPSRMF